MSSTTLADPKPVKTFHGVRLPVSKDGLVRNSAVVVQVSVVPVIMVVRAVARGRSMQEHKTSVVGRSIVKEWRFQIKNRVGIVL